MPEIGLVEITDALARLASTTLDIYPHQCVRSRHRKAQCSLCAEHCPSGAITLQANLQIDEKQCTRCGVCAAVCPTGVFEASSPSNAELLQQINELVATVPLIAFVCPRVAGEETAGMLRVPCLGRVDASIQVGAAAIGIQHIELVDGECASCPDCIGHAVAQQAMDESNTLIQALGHAPRVSFVAQSSLIDPSRQTRQSSAQIPLESVSPKRMQATESFKKGELPIRVPAKTQLLLSNLERLDNPNAASELDTRLWAKVITKASCSGCQMCTFFCPVGALIKMEENGKPSVAFKHAYCTNCHLCAEICYTGSIALSSRIDLKKVVSQVTEIVWSNTPSSSHDEKIKRLKMFKH